MYNAGVMRASGKDMAVDCPAAVALLSRLARLLQLPHLANAETAFNRGHYQRALWHYLVASEGGINLASLNALWLINRGCGQTLSSCPSPGFFVSCCFGHM
jgi:hypothetical protein